MRLIADAAQVWMVRDGGRGGPDWADTLSEVGGAKKNKKQEETVRRTKFTGKTNQSERK